MKQSITQRLLDQAVYYHLVFPTYHRLPLFKAEPVKGAVLEIIEETLIERDIDVLIYNLLSDHIHLLIYKQYHQSIPDLVKYIKGRSTYYFYESYPDYKIDGHRRLWARGYHTKVVKTVTQFENTVLYIQNNYDRHIE